MSVCDLAVQRALWLYSLAVEALRCGDIERARRLCGLARELLESARCRKPRRLRKGWGVCAGCGVPLVYGVSASVRLSGRGRFRWLVVRCLVCGYIHRRPYKGAGGGG